MGLLSFIVITVKEIVYTFNRPFNFLRWKFKSQYNASLKPPITIREKMFLPFEHCFPATGKSKGLAKNSE